ncbi:hypothetical protein PQC16_gp145 [Rhizobium phage RHph_TM30]|uniref:Uncharacterized protein n=1 Tax=Rhizobium phage RHph_TM30 TaxID=2509764 RepID=A0A7S5R511_9CAUD|nr:hypothetical protein PQC16_gp145 [Rhizobium phage RHph_TM30]QIG71252.1 hypothetical protein EVB93_145 [Rhizobium phage RHph_TM30]
MIRFTIEQNEDCWSYSSEVHGLHMGYPDALQATAAAMRAFDPSISYDAVSVDDVKDHLIESRRSKFTIVGNNNE